MTPEQKIWIDGASYEELLRRWRFAAVGDQIFRGDTGEYYQKVMEEKRKRVGESGHVSASKSIGWER